MEPLKDPRASFLGIRWPARPATQRLAFSQLPFLQGRSLSFLSQTTRMTTTTSPESCLCRGSTFPSSCATRCLFAWAMSSSVSTTPPRPEALRSTSRLSPVCCPSLEWRRAPSTELMSTQRKAQWWQSSTVLQMPGSLKQTQTIS